MQGDVYSLKVGKTVHPYAVLTPPYGTPFAADDTAKGMNLLTRWQHRLADQSEMTLQAYFDQTEFSAPKLRVCSQSIERSNAI